jgi:hypothetical protein
MLGGPRRWGRFFGAGRGRSEPTSGDGWDARRLPVGVGQEGARLWDDLENRMPPGLSRERGERRVRGDVEIGTGDGDPLHVGLENWCGRLRPQFLHPHRLRAPAATQRHLPGSPGVTHPPHRPTSRHDMLDAYLHSGMAAPRIASSLRIVAHLRPYPGPQPQSLRPAQA